MKKYVQLAFIACILIGVFKTKIARAKQKEIVLESMPSYLDTIRIDGDINDWLNQQIAISKKDNISYAISTDSSAVTLLLIYNDMPMMMSVLRQGLNIVIDSKGKKNKNSGVGFPVQQRRDSIRPAGSVNREEIFEAMNQRLAMMVKSAGDSLVLFGCRQEYNGRFATGQSAVRAALAKPGRDSLIIELKFPFTLLAEAPQPGKPFSVGIILNAPEENDGFAPTMGMPDFDPAAGPPDMPPPSVGGAPWESERLEFWIKSVRL